MSPYSPFRHLLSYKYPPTCSIRVTRDWRSEYSLWDRIKEEKPGLTFRFPSQSHDIASFGSIDLPSPRAFLCECATFSTSPIHSLWSSETVTVQTEWLTQPKMTMTKKKKKLSNSQVGGIMGRRSSPWEISAAIQQLSLALLYWQFGCRLLMCERLFRHPWVGN